MKKLAFLFVAVAAISFASCGGATKADAAAQDSTACGDSCVAVEAVEAVEVTPIEGTDSVEVDTTVAVEVVAE